MRVLVFVNHVFEIGFRQTTALLIAAFHNRGHDVYLANFDDLCNEASAANVTLRTRCFAFSRFVSEDRTDSNTVEAAVEAAKEAGFDQFIVGQNDLILIRTNPGRDEQRQHLHTTFIEFCQLATKLGIRVINRPTELMFFASKASTSLLGSHYRPPMLTTNSVARIVEFILQTDRDCVVKPLIGSRGLDVVRVSKRSDDLHEMLQDRYEGRSVMVQHFVESSDLGDKRVIVLNGKILESNGHVAGIHRLPAKGDFRANLHAGGSAHELTLDAGEREAVEQSAEILFQGGIALAGVDIIGSKVIEFNVFSTGGLFDCCRFSKVDFADRVVEILTL